MKAHNIPYHMVNGIDIRDDGIELENKNLLIWLVLNVKKTDDMFYDIYMKMLDIQDLYEKSAYLKIKCTCCNKGLWFVLVT